MCSITTDLPLHDRCVIATKREQVGVARVEAYLGNVATVAEEWLEGRVLDHGGVPVQFDLAIVVCSGYDFVTVGERTVCPVCMVDV